MIVWRLRGNIIRTALCIVWHNVHSPQHTYVSSSYRSNILRLSHWGPYAVRRGGCLELYYCNMVEWFWWDSSLILTTNWFPSLLLHCWFGHLACKNRPRNDLLCVDWDAKPYTLTPLSLSWSLWLKSLLTLTAVGGEWWTASHGLKRGWPQIDSVLTHWRPSSYGLPHPLPAAMHNRRDGQKLTVFFRGLWQSVDLIPSMFGIKQDENNMKTSLETAYGALHRFKTSWTLVDKCSKIEPPWLATVCKFSILFPCQPKHLRSENRTLSNSATCWEVSQICKCVSTILLPFSYK